MLKQILYRSIAIAVFFGFCLSVNAQITDGPNITGTGTNIGGAGLVDWNNSGNITADDGNNAVVSLKKKTSGYLAATGFGFAIPTGATITGVTVEIDHYSASASVTYNSGDGLFLTTDGSNYVGNDKGGGVAWPTTPGSTSTYGGTNDLWGATLLPADINSANFGVLIKIDNPVNASYNSYVDYVSISVTYTIPAPTITSLSIGSGCPGDMLTITGNNLTGATSVTIGSTAATIVGNTATEVKVTVGSGTTGAVVVTTSSGTTTDDPTFTVNPAPSAPGSITSDSPQCEGTGVTFTKGSCGSGNTCYWVSSATGTETTNSSDTYTTSTAAGTYTVWVREYNGDCWGPAVSATGTVNSAPVVTTQPSNQSVVADAGTAIFSVTATDASDYQWQESTDDGSSWSDVTDGGVYSGETTSTLTITNAGSTYSDYQYRCVLTGSCGNTNSDVAILNIIAADYCTYSSTSSDYYIDYFSTTNGYTNITNNNSGYSTGGYGDFTGQSAAQSQGMTVDFDVSFGSESSYTFGVGIYIDWNQDGDFDDADETAFISSGYQSSFTGTITVPASALTGDTRMRVACDYYDSAPEACGDISNGEAEDYTFHVDPGAPMAFSSMTTTQTMTMDVSPGTSNAEIIGIEIVTSGMSDPFDVTSFNLNTNGSTNASGDIVNARLYTTGTNSAFATTSQFGSTVAGPSGAFTINGTETLATGTNYFWLVYDVASSATLGNVGDAECSGATIDGSTETTTTSAPAGNRVISNTYLISNTSDVSTCSGTFYDSGNIGGDYVNNELYTKTFTSATPGSVLQFVFNSFATESGYDELTIYDGPDNTYPVIGIYDGTTTSPGTITSSSESLTFEFDSDGSNVDAGWDADISCVPITVPNCVSINSPVNNEADVCPGSVVLAWSPSGSGFAPSGYKLYVGTDAAATNIINGSDIGNTLNYTLTNLDGNTLYYWNVVPYNSAGINSTCTSIVSFTTLDIGITSTNSPISTCSNSYDLTASGGTGTVTWYNVPTGGSPIGTGSPFTASFNGDATFYVAEESSGTGSEYGGMPAAIETSGYLSSGSNLGIVFDANDDFTLNAVDIYPVGTGTVDIALLNDAGTEIASTGDISITSGDGSVQTVSLNFNVTAGNNYKLILKSYSGITDLYRDFSASFPFDSPSGALSVTGGWWDGSSTSNYYFYNLEITAGCVSARTPVYVTHTADPVSISADGPTTFLDGGSVQLTATSATAYTYSWSPATGLNTTTGATVTASPNTTTTYTVTGDNGSGCQYAEDITITVTYPCIGLGTGHFPIANLPFSETSTTCGNVDDITSSNATVCGSTSYYTGKDVVYSFEPNSDGLVTIDLTSSGTYTGLMLYEGCPMSGQGGTCIANKQSSAGNESICVNLQADMTYYLVIDSYAAPDCNNYNITISAPDPVGVPGDLPCDATPIAIGGIQAGNNACASGVDEPGAATCWTSGNLNTVWYLFEAPASGSVKIRTILGSLTATQIAVYQGECTNLTLVSNACNVDATGTCSGTEEFSDLELTGLTPGNTYYIRVDGENDLTGSFDIQVIDGTEDWPTIPQQDCSSATLVCAQQTIVGDPGFLGAGSTCDYTTPYGCFSFGTQNNTVWYQIDIENTGTLTYEIIPNLSTTDYDWVLVDVTGNSSACDQIADGTLPPTRCNFSGTSGTTGLSSSASETSVDAGGAPFCSEVSATAGETYLLLIWNWSGNNTGFTLDLYSSPAVYDNPEQVTWSGGASTDWFDPINWGGCAIPACDVDAIIVNGPTNQPVIDATGAECANITIESGASLTINPGYSLRVCENVNNSGSLIADPTSTILFDHASNSHEINGSLTGTNALGNLSVDKAAGMVTFMQDIEIGGDLTTANTTSIINTNGKTVYIGGDFITANATFTNIGTTGYLVFNGNAAQDYKPTGTLSLNKVTMNNTGSGVNLYNDLIVDGLLKLTNGIIHTSSTYKVHITNTSPSAITNGNTVSYINGNLRRDFNQVNGTYAFPLGTSTAYRLAQIDNKGLDNITYFDGEFLASFDNGGSLNFSIAYDGALVYEEVASEGIWRITPNNSPSNGNYDVKLYFDDGGGAQAFAGLIDNQFGILKRDDYSNSASDWSGAPVGSLPALGSSGRMVADGYATRIGITAFSEFGIGKQNTLLPIELLSFNGTCIDDVVEITWTTASETNNDYFTLFRSIDADKFEPVATIPGQGNSNELNDYAYVDKNTFNNKQYYRLRQTDFDGQYAWSDIIFVNCGQDMGGFTISPNPFTENIYIIFDKPTQGRYMIEIYDMLGQVVYEDILPENSRKVIIDEIQNLNPCTYYLRIQSNDGVKTQKLIKM